MRASKWPQVGSCLGIERTIQRTRVSSSLSKAQLSLLMLVFINFLFSFLDFITRFFMLQSNLMLADKLLFVYAFFCFFFFLFCAFRGNATLNCKTLPRCALQLPVNIKVALFSANIHSKRLIRDGNWGKETDYQMYFSAELKPAQLTGQKWIMNYENLKQGFSGGKCPTSRYPAWPKRAAIAITLNLYPIQYIKSVNIAVKERGLADPIYVLDQDDALARFSCVS